jgi:ABC-type transport system involved in multi-copper enzyme maturation permease subunit
LGDNSDGHKSPLAAGFFRIVHAVIPNFGNYNIQNPIIHPDVHIVDMGRYIGSNIVYAIFYTAICIIIAVLIFDKREV